MSNSIEDGWINLSKFWEEKFGKSLSIQAALWVISMQEYPRLHTKYSSPDAVVKEDLLHLAVCFILEIQGFCVFENLDNDGWPRYSSIAKFENLSLKEQETILARGIVCYFDNYE